MWKAFRLYPVFFHLVNRTFTLGLIESFGKQDVLRELKRYLVALLVLKTCDFLGAEDIADINISSVSFFVLYVKACMLIASQGATTVSYRMWRTKIYSVLSTLPWLCKRTTRPRVNMWRLSAAIPIALTPRSYLDHFEASTMTRWSYLTAAIALPNCHVKIKKIVESLKKLTSSSLPRKMM